MKKFEIKDVNELETVLFALSSYKKDCERDDKDVVAKMELEYTTKLIDDIVNHLNA